MKKVILEIVKESEEQDKYIGHGFYGMYDISFQINLNGKNLKDILFDKNEWIKNKRGALCSLLFFVLLLFFVRLFLICHSVYQIFNNQFFYVNIQAQHANEGKELQ